MNGWDRRAAVDAAVDQPMPAVIWQVGFINTKTCYLHMLVRDVKINSNVRKALGGQWPPNERVGQAGGRPSIIAGHDMADRFY
jgi:hypothetical protein